jgi:hypothetical protein
MATISGERFNLPEPFGGEEPDEVLLRNAEALGGKAAEKEVFMVEVRGNKSKETEQEQRCNAKATKAEFEGILKRFVRNLTSNNLAIESLLPQLLGSCQLPRNKINERLDPLPRIPSRKQLQQHVRLRLKSGGCFSSFLP